MVRAWYAAAVVAGFTAIPAMAGSVDLNTYVGSEWTVQRFQSPDATTTTTDSDHLAVKYAYNSAWSAPFPLGLGLSWVTSNDPLSTSGDQNGTTYRYQKAFSLDFDENGSPVEGQASFTLDGRLSADNWITGASLTYKNGTKFTDVVLTPVPTEDERTFTYAITAYAGPTVFHSPADFILTVDVVNSYAPGTHLGENPGPTAFIFEGSANAEPFTGQTVPLPAAAWAGFSMLGGLGLVARVRKSLRQAD